MISSKGILPFVFLYSISSKVIPNTCSEYLEPYLFYRLVNPKIVRACTVVLSDWETLPAETIKSAVTILYRIAFVAKMPMMLCQVNTTSFFFSSFK